MQDRLNDSGAWPVFEVGLGGGANLSVVYRNFDEDASVDYLLVPGPDRDCIALATGEGNGSGISWSELNTVARRYPGVPEGSAALLVAPVPGDVNGESSSATAVIVKALRALGADGDVEALAELIVSENPLWEPAQWRRTKDGLTTCDAESSLRNPAGPVSLSQPPQRMTDVPNPHDRLWLYTLQRV